MAEVLPLKTEGTQLIKKPAKQNSYTEPAESENNLCWSDFYGWVYRYWDNSHTGTLG